MLLGGGGGRVYISFVGAGGMGFQMLFGGSNDLYLRLLVRAQGAIGCCLSVHGLAEA